VSHLEIALVEFGAKLMAQPAVNFINILRAHFLYESLFKAKTYLEKAAETMFI